MKDERGSIDGAAGRRHMGEHTYLEDMLRDETAFWEGAEKLIASCLTRLWQPPRRGAD